MNGMWGYKVADQDYKSADELIELLVRAAAKGSNLLLNIGPQPNGELPVAALQRLRDIGKWMAVYGNSIYNTRKGHIEEASWGVSTQSDQYIFLHVLNRQARQLEITLPKKPRMVTSMKDNTPLFFKYNRRKKVLAIDIPEHGQVTDYVVKVC